MVQGLLNRLPGGLFEKPPANRVQGRHQGRSNPESIENGGRRPNDGQPVVDGFGFVDELQHHALTVVVLAQGAAHDQGQNETGGPQQGARQGVELPKFPAQLMKQHLQQAKQQREGRHRQQ